MTDRIRDFLRNRREARRIPALASSSISMSCARTITRFARALPDTRVFYAVKANPATESSRPARAARLVFRRRLGGRDRAGARGRRDARPHQLRQHDQEGEATSRAPLSSASASLPSIARPRSRRSRARRRDRKCSAASSATARAPNGRYRASSAARRTWRRACSSTRTALGLIAHGLSFHVGSQQPQPAHVGRRAEGLGRRSSATLPSAASSSP